MRLIIYDEHLLFSEALSSLFASRGHEVLACPTTPEETAELAATSEVDACLLDLPSAPLEAAAVVSLVRRRLPDLPLVALSSELEPSALWRALEAGANGICLRVDGVDEIERVVREAVRAREGPSSRTWSRAARALARRGSPTRRSAALTPRERAVLELLARGAATGEIAAKLGVGDATVRTHLQHLFAKFGVHSRLALVAHAIRTEVIPAQPEAPQVARSG
ncbi:MAG TPA: response regulator transcription factor [Acidimicrobiales bacterium]|nr:response regulator transcription factor [Acidimicrobiales bacterium]